MPRRNTPDHSYFDSVITQLELSVGRSCSGGREEEHLSDKEGKSYSIVCDQLGMPTEAYDEKGKLRRWGLWFVVNLMLSPRRKMNVIPGEVYAIPGRHPPYDASISKGFKRRRQKVCLLSYNIRPRLEGDFSRSIQQSRDFRYIYWRSGWVYAFISSCNYYPLRY